MIESKLCSRIIRLLFFCSFCRLALNVEPLKKVYQTMSAGEKNACFGYKEKLTKLF